MSISEKSPMSHLSSLEGYNSIIKICYFGQVSLMLISFITLFITSQRTKDKQYGTN